MVYKEKSRKNKRKFHLIGKVENSSPRGLEVSWCDGKKEYINPNQMPEEFTKYSKGQDFEALDEWFKSLSITDSLPESNTTWKSLI